MFLRGTTVLPAAGVAVLASSPARSGETLLADAHMRGTIDATELGVAPGTFDDQSRRFEKLLQAAADRNMPVFLPPGTYVVSNMALPKTVRLTGVLDATRIVYGGDGRLFSADQTDLFHLENITIDGANRWLDDNTEGLIDLRGVNQLLIDNCHVIGSSKHGLSLEHCAGRVAHSEISGAENAGLYAVESQGLTIDGNRVSNCGNGGILVHRWKQADDGTSITANRVSRISARNGGTGQNGNGINVFRADNVMVLDNMVSDCAFSAIRANSASNIQIANNKCLRSGETAIYAEFAFEGAVITGNLVDGACDGISMTNFDNGGRMSACTGNIIRNLSTIGPYEADGAGFGAGICVEADATLTGNVIENAPRVGISIGWGPYMRTVVATGNVIRLARVGIAVSVVEGVGSAVVTGNVIDKARDGAILGYRWAKVATSDLALEPSPGGKLTVERNQVS